MSVVRRNDEISLNFAINDKTKRFSLVFNLTKLNRVL